MFDEAMTPLVFKGPFPRDAIRILTRMPVLCKKWQPTVTYETENESETSSYPLVSSFNTILSGEMLNKQMTPVTPGRSLQFKKGTAAGSNDKELMSA